MKIGTIPDIEKVVSALSTPKGLWTALKTWLVVMTVVVVMAVGAGVGGAIAEPYLAIGAITGGLLVGVPAWFFARRRFLN
jgi:H+/Cl- antiporter ClcA